MAEMAGFGNSSCQRTTNIEVKREIKKTINDQINDQINRYFVNWLWKRLLVT